MKTITIHNNHGQSLDIPATVVGPLAVHREFSAATGEIVSRKWIVTHVESGLSVLHGARLKRIAMEAARPLADLDWDLRDEVLKREKLSALWPMVKKQRTRVVEMNIA